MPKSQPESSSNYFIEGHSSPAGRSGDVTEEQFIEKDVEQLPLNFIKEDGSALVKIIKPGWGSSGYYSVEVLERDAGKVYIPPTHMHIDHPTALEDKDRPERSLLTLAGVIEGTGQFMKDGPRGPGVYAPTHVFRQFREFLNERAAVIGVSHRVWGSAKTGLAEGREGKIIEKLHRCESVDFVTHPGAGGELVPMYESWRRGQDDILLEEAPGCKISLGDVFPGKQYGDLSAAEKSKLKGLFAWVAPDPQTFGDYHLPYKDPATGKPKVECVRNALARLDQVQGLSGDEADRVRSMLERTLEQLKKQEESMSEFDITKMNLTILKEARPDIINELREALMQEIKDSEATKKKEADHQNLVKENETLKEQNARLIEHQAIATAAVFVGKALEKVQVPDATKKRLAESLPKQAVIKDGKLDETEFGKIVDAAIKTESEYAQTLMGHGRVSDFGAGAGGGAGEKPGVLKESFKDMYLRQGLPEKEAERMATLAAEGRR